MPLINMPAIEPVVPQVKEEIAPTNIEGNVFISLWSVFLCCCDLNEQNIVMNSKVWDPFCYRYFKFYV